MRVAELAEDLQHGREHERRRASPDGRPEERRRPERDVLRKERFDCGDVRRGDGGLPALDELLGRRHTHGDTLRPRRRSRSISLSSTHARRSRPVRARTNGGGRGRRPREGPSRLRALAGRRAGLRPPPVRARRAERRLRGPRDRRLPRLLDRLARLGRTHPRGPGRLARAGHRQDRGVAPEHRRRRPRGVGGARRGRREGDPARSSRTASTSSSSTPGRTTTSCCSSSRGPSSTRAGSSSPTTSRRAPTVEAYAAARQADPTLVSVTVPIGHGLEVTTVLRP